MSFYLKDEPEIDKVFEFFDKCYKEPADTTPIRFYVDSDGWSQQEFSIICDRLNALVDAGYPVTLHIMYACSAAFELCWDFKGKKIVELNADWMVHMCYLKVPSHRGVVITQDAVSRGRKESYEEEEMRQYDFLTEEEKQRYNSGLDVYISPLRMKSLFSQEQSVLQ